MWSKGFWKDAVERAIRTTAQVIVALAAAAGTGLLDTDWLATLSAAGMAGVLSVLTSIAAGVSLNDGTASTIPGAGAQTEPAQPADGVPVT
jgi:r1t holin